MNQARTSSTIQIEKDIMFLQDICDMTNDQCDDIINACEDLGGISAEYFCEEFVFIPDGETPEECARFHDVEYLDITEFNYHHWIGNKMEDY